MTEKRLDWIDAAKAIGMLLVIFNHFNLDYGQNSLKVVIASFHMPLFFFLSGVTMKDESFSWIGWLGYIKRKASMLIVPYILWAAVFTNGVAGNRLLYIAYASNKSLQKIGSNATLWFLPCMFLAAILSRSQLSIAVRIGGKKLVICIFAVINFVVGWILTGYLNHFHELDYPFSLNVMFIASGFILLGHLLFRIACNIKGRGIGKRLLVIAFSLVILLVTSLNNFDAFSNSWHRIVMARSFFGSLLLFILSGCAGSIIVILLSSFFSGRYRVLNRIGKETLIILAIHQQFIVFAKERMTRLSLNPGGLAICILVLVSFAILILSSLISFVLKKSIPNLAGIAASRQR